jgi:branched-chain amino acid transport system substrate-binding protein
MALTRRSVLAASAGAAASAVGGLFRPAFAQSGHVRVGWLAALTGPSSATGIAMDRGISFAFNEINSGAGVRGRKLELITRDTQSDPTKAVNAAAELTHGEKVDVIWGPTNSGEALAATPVIARAGVPMIHPCWVDQLIDVVKYPFAFRLGPTNQQIGRAANRYAIEISKIHEIALLSDTTGYGTASVQAFAPMIHEMGGQVVYQAAINSSQPDLKPDMMRMRASGAKVIMPWSVNAGFLARILNTRANLGWDVPVIGQTTLGSGQIKALLDKPSSSCSTRFEDGLPA